MRRAALALVVVAAAAAAVLASRDDAPEPRPFPADRLLFARDDWVRAPERKLAAAAVGAACGVSFGSGDLDGDGGPDTVLTYSTGPDCGRYDRFAVMRSGGRVQQGQIDGDLDDKTGQMCPSGCRVFAVADLNSDGRDEVVLELSHGASQVQLSVYRLGSRGLVRLTVGQAGREPARFSYYGSMCCGSHLSCRGRDVVVASSYGRSVFGSVFVGETVYRFDGRRFVEIGRRAYPQRAAGDRRGTSVPGRACIEPV